MTETIAHTVPGLHQPAEINVDQWGICHIRAGNRRDAFFVQGFNAARDRLWQIDIWRKRGLGRMAADFGPGFLAQDRAARLFLYRGDMQAEWAAYGTPEAQDVTEAFVAGINAWITLTEANPALLSPEFAAMGTRPERWATPDVVRIRSHGLVRNVLSEATRARVLAAADLETDLARRSIEPPHTIVIPEGLDPACIPDDVLDVFRLATAAPDFTPERLEAPLADAWRWTRVSDQGDVTLQGSNNWAVAATHTDTGRPILASDPHRAHALPSLRSVVHLSAPGLDVIGAGEPALPGVSIGHNGHAAFSLTIFPMDQEDLYVYETEGDGVRHGGGVERMAVLRETIAVRGCADQEVTLKFTRHGPVVCETPGHAFAVRSVWSEPGASAYFAALAYIGAKSVDAFEAALSHWSTPSVNQVYADVSGRVAWFVAGKSPVRPNWDGLLPVPGDGRYEWRGFHPFTALPRTIDPATGFVATANEMNLPDGFPSEDIKLGFEWAERSRSTRIHQVLAGQNPHTSAQSMALQTDDTSIPAKRLTALLEGIVSPGAALLAAWNHRLERHAPAAALYEVWWSKHLKPALLDLLAPDPVARKLMVPGDVETLLAALEDGHPRIPDRAGLLATTLEAAYADCQDRLGPNQAAWQWGQLHHGAFPHPLARVADMPGVDRLPKGGSGSTVMAAVYRLSDFKVTHGASFRMVVDVGNWDESRFINAPGQSGDPRSPHYANLAPLWAEGSYVPMLYSVAAVDAATTLKIRLSP